MKSKITKKGSESKKATAKKTAKKYSCVCVNCKTSYQSVIEDVKVFYTALNRIKKENPDEYAKMGKVYQEGYCDPCLVEKKRMFAEIEARIGARLKRAIKPKDIPFSEKIDADGVSHVVYRARDLGLI